MDTPRTMLSLALAALMTAACSGREPAAAVGPAAAPRRDVPVTALAGEAALADVALLRRALETVHAGYGRDTPRSELDAAFDALSARAAGGLTDLELYGEISLLLARIRCGHTRAELPPRLARLRSQQATHMPFRLVVEGGRVWVYASDPEQPRLAPGSEILALDGQRAGAVLDLLAAAVPVDGATDHVKPALLAADGDFMGSAFDHFYPIFFGFRQGVGLRLRRPDGGEEDRTLDLITYARWQGLPWPRETWRGDLVDAVRLERPQPGLAVLTVETFVNDRRPVDPDTLYGPIFRRLAAERVESLILDLRRNAGGSDDAALALARRLIGKPFRYRRPSRVRAYRFDGLRQHLSARDESVFTAPAEWFRPLSDGSFEVSTEWDPPAHALQQPAPERFTGRLHVLIGPRNRGQATMLLAVLKGLREAVFVGEPTGGSSEGPSAGVPVFLELPASGITVRIPAMRQFLEVADFEPGRGVEPDVTVATRLQDLLAGQDPVMAAARRLAAGDQAPAPSDR